MVWQWHLEVNKDVKLKKLVSLLNLRRNSAQICFFAEDLGALTFEAVVFRLFKAMSWRM